MLTIDLRGKKAFIAGIGDDQGFGWAIAKVLAAAGAEILVGTWPPVYNIFTTSLERGKFDASRLLPDGSLLTFSKVYPLEAAYDFPEDLPADILENKRYKDLEHYTISEVAKQVEADYGKIDIFIHALANSPEASKPLLETTRRGYLSTLSASSYSWVSLLSHFAPVMHADGAALTLSYIAAQKVIPGYGGGLNAAKAALESDTRLLAYEVGRRYGVRVNAISAGVLASRAAKAIGFIEKMIDYAEHNAPLKKGLEAEEVAHAAAFLVSPLASAITGTILYVDNGINVMGVAEKGLQA